ncbi:hypothetical protein GYMLUDRAFT_550838 [Collybiopsis luxurians FD-317 M1]|uniref:Unplaced genomic scaffold GYMLUscaffold_20, whole genome shotgun sequence n=1 Tax=Collybiopsis luxurians FD-317 M1 TaxID=944289 RepID=A0A0D0C1Z7_9AGAR|nr:hypothetical protein GYMLUDRAFT_550838 [Collybiopsis luxurians FD-317 M1]
MASLAPNSAAAATEAQPGTVQMDRAPQELAKLWQDAVEKFKNSKQVKLKEWDETLKSMASCKSVEDFCKVLEDNFFNKFKKARGSEKWITLRDKYLKPGVEIIIKLSDTVGDLVDSTLPGGKIIFTAISFLLKVCRTDFFKCSLFIT